MSEPYKIDIHVNVKAGLRVLYDDERAVIDEQLQKLSRTPEKLGKSFEHED